MKTLYVASPFSRFELGQQIAIAIPPPDACKIGEIALRMPNGAIVCSKSSPASSMFMPVAPGVGNVGYGPSMGQMEDPYLTQTERDAILAQIDAAVKNIKPLDDMIVWSSDNDPKLKNMLGSDYTRFWALSNSIAPLYGTVEDLGTRLREVDAEAWYRPGADELAAVKQWTIGVNEMYKILQAHKTPAKPLPLTSKPPPSIAPTQVVTAMPKGGTLTSTGPTTTEYLVATGLAVGIGTVLYALLG